MLSLSESEAKLVATDASVLAAVERSVSLLFFFDVDDEEEDIFHELIVDSSGSLRFPLDSIS